MTNPVTCRRNSSSSVLFPLWGDIPAGREQLDPCSAGVGSSQRDSPQTKGERLTESIDCSAERKASPLTCSPNTNQHRQRKSPTSLRIVDRRDYHPLSFLVMIAYGFL